MPDIDWSRTGRGVLTLERIEGVRIDDRAGLIAAGHSVQDVLAKAACAFFNQVFRDGFFHADLHPGNMFVDASGALVVIDFGIMGRLDIATRKYLADMLIGFLIGDYRRVAQVHFDAGYVPATRSINSFTQACRAIGEPILGRPLQEISVARLLAQLFQVTEQFDMETQPQLLLLQKTMVLGGGGGPPPRSRDQHLGNVATADRELDARQSRPRGADCVSVSTQSSTCSTVCRGSSKRSRTLSRMSPATVSCCTPSRSLPMPQEQAKRAWLAVLPFYIAAAALVAIAADLIFWH